MDSLGGDSAQERFRSRRFSATRTQLIQKPVSHDSLREHAFFKGRNTKLLDVVLDNMRVEFFLPGTYIIKEGDFGDCMYFMNRGEVEVLLGSAEKRVTTLKDGSLFGEMSLLGNGMRTASVRTLEVCECRVISAAAFHTCLRRFPDERQYFHQLAKERLAELAKASVKATASCSLRRLSGDAARRNRRSSRGTLACNRIKAWSAQFASTPAVIDESVEMEEEEDDPYMKSLVPVTECTISGRRTWPGLDQESFARQNSAPAEEGRDLGSSGSVESPCSPASCRSAPAVNPASTQEPIPPPAKQSSHNYRRPSIKFLSDVADDCSGRRCSWSRGSNASNGPTRPTHKRRLSEIRFDHTRGSQWKPLNAIHALPSLQAEHLEGSSWQE